MAYQPIRFLSGDQVAFEPMPGGELAMKEHQARWEYVRAFRTHPLSDPGGYIALRACASGSTTEEEVGVLRALRELSATDRKLVEEALARRYLVQTIRQIRNIREEFGYMYWDVVSERGERQLVLPRWNQANVVEMGDSGRGRIVIDVWGNRSLIHDLRDLDDRSQRTFERFVHW